MNHEETIKEKPLNILLQSLGSIRLNLSPPSPPIMVHQPSMCLESGGVSDGDPCDSAWRVEVSVMGIPVTVLGEWRCQ